MVLSKEIEEQIKAFQSSGGKITTVSPGETGQEYLHQNIKEISERIRLRKRREKNEKATSNSTV